MPTPIFELQRRLTEIGRIRAGDKSEKGAPRRLRFWRITSSSEEIITQVAERYGGKPQPWQSPVGAEFEVYTEADELPVMVMPGYSLRQTYELWEGPSKCSRRCDGVDESVTGAPCICNATGVDSCDLHTRLTVVLPELTTVQGWRLETKGQNAAHELRGSMSIADGLAASGPFVAGVLRLTERRGQQNGQATRYVVPVIDFRISWSTAAAAIAGSAAIAELPSPAPYVALPAADRRGGGASLAEGLDVVEKADTRAKTSRSAEDVGPSEVEPSEDEIEIEDEGLVLTEEKPKPKPPPPPADREDYEEARKTKLATAAQKKKLNVLVGKLRDERGLIKTVHLWQAMKKEPVLSVEDGELHWSPLRELLTRVEAGDLIERLEKLDADMPADA